MKPFAVASRNALIKEYNIKRCRILAKIAEMTEIQNKINRLFNMENPEVKEEFSKMNRNLSPKSAEESGRTK